MKKQMKNSISFIVGLITMFFIFITSLSLLLDRIILNEQTYFRVIERENIIEQVDTYINDNINYLLAASNIPEDTLRGVISREEIKDIIYENVYFTVNFMRNGGGDIEALDTSVYEERIDKKLTSYLRENQMYVGAEFKENLDVFKADILNNISGSIQFVDLNKLSQSPMLSVIAKLSSIVSGLKFFILLMAIITILSMSQFIIWTKRRKSRRYAWIGYPFISGGMIISLIGYSGYLSGFYKNIAIGMQYYKNTISAILGEYLMNFTYIGIVFIMIGLLFMALYWMHLVRVYSYKKKKTDTKPTTMMVV